MAENNTSRKCLENVIKDNFVIEMFKPYCETLECAIDREENPAARKSFTTMLEKIKTAKQKDSDIINQFYRLVETKETLKQIWKQHSQSQPANNQTWSDCMGIMSIKEDELGKENADLKRTCESNQVEINILKIQNKDQQMKIDALSAQNVKHEEEIKELKSKLRIQANKIEELETKNKEIYGKYKEKDKEFENTKKKLVEIKTELENTKTELNKTKSKLEGTTTELENTKSRLAAVETELGLSKDNRDIFLLSQLFVDCEKKMYLHIHRNASTSFNYYVRDIETHHYNNQEEKAAALRKWENLKRKISWRPHLATITKPVREYRNNLAHPPTPPPKERKLLLERLKHKGDITNDDYMNYVEFFDCYERLETIMSQ